jgi:hypothetical protein
MLRSNRIILFILLLAVLESCSTIKTNVQKLSAYNKFIPVSSLIKRNNIINKAIKQQQVINEGGKKETKISRGILNVYKVNIKDKSAAQTKNCINELIRKNYNTDPQQNIHYKKNFSKLTQFNSKIEINVWLKLSLIFFGIAVILFLVFRTEFLLFLIINLLPVLSVILPGIFAVGFILMFVLSFIFFLIWIMHITHLVKV